MKRDKRPMVFFDFDNTITTYDVMDDMLARFSINERWKDLEERWKEHKIGSRECLKGQIEGIRIKKETLDNYLSKVKIDPYFKVLLECLDSKKIKAVILSDNFDYILKSILKNNEIGNLSVYSNYLKLRDDRLVPRFRSPNGDCSDGNNCAHCKKNTLLANLGKGHKAVYIGDGRSDICAAKAADMVFAKDYLLKYCETNGLSHLPFKNFKDIYGYFEKEVS